MTSKRQVTLPKDLADAYGIAPGDEIDWQPAGDAIRVVPRGRVSHGLTIAERLALFDEETRRRDQRLQEMTGTATPGQDRAWTRDELHDRGRTR